LKSKVGKKNLKKAAPALTSRRRKEKAYNVPFDMLAAWLRNQTGKLFPKFV